MANLDRSSSDLEQSHKSSTTPIVHDEKAHDGTAHDENVNSKFNGAGDNYEAAQAQWTYARVVAIASLCLVYVGAQEILYFTGGALTYIGYDIGTSIPNWLLTANTLAVTAIVPFVGYLTDLLGRKWITLGGSLLLVIGSIVMATTHSLGSAVTAMALSGIGAGICELTALAGVAEITPVRWRGAALAVVTFSIVPFMPYLLYIELLEIHASWRWVYCIAAIWNFIGLLGLLFCYKPPPRHNVDNQTAGEILSKIDYVGAFLSIAGVTLFLVGLQAGGYQYPWTSGRVLGPLIVGIILIILFPIWESLGAKNPMVPKAIFEGQRVVALALVIVFIAGMFFYSILGFFPVILTTYYPPDPIRTGVRALGYPIAILSGACIISLLMSYTKGHVREMFFICATIMTAFGGALAAATPFNPGFAVAMATISSFGVGAIVVPSLTLALYASPDRYIGTTAALSLCVRFLGGSIGTTIYFNIFNNKIKANLPAYVAKAALGAGLPMGSLQQFIMALVDPINGAKLVTQVPGVNEQIITAGSLALRWAYADSLKYVWYATIPFGIISMICCALVPNIRNFMTSRVAVLIH